MHPGVHHGPGRRLDLVKMPVQERCSWVKAFIEEKCFPMGPHQIYKFLLTMLSAVSLISTLHGL